MGHMLLCSRSYTGVRNLRILESCPSTDPWSVCSVYSLYASSAVLLSLSAASADARATHEVGVCSTPLQIPSRNAWPLKARRVLWLAGAGFSTFSKPWRGRPSRWPLSTTW